LAFVFLPNPDTDENNTNGKNWLDNFFLIEPFTLNGKSYYNYRLFIFAGIIINTFVTLVYEKWII